MKVLSFAFALAACLTGPAVLGCGSGESPASVEDPAGDEDEVDDLEAKADGVSTPIGSYEATDPESVGAKDFSLIVLKTDKAFHATRGPDSTELDGTYKFTKARNTAIRYVWLTPAGATKVRYEYRLDDSRLTLKATAKASPRDFKRAEPAWCGEAADCELQNLTKPQCPKPWTCDSSRCVAPNCGGSTSSPGLVPETAQISAVVMASADNFGPLLQFQGEMLSNLPNDVKAYLILARGNPFKNYFGAEFEAGRFVALTMATDSNWARDYFPPIKASDDGSFSGVNFAYARQGAHSAGQELLSQIGLSVYESPLTYEGGNIMVDESNTLFTTEKVVSTNTKLNPSMTKETIDAELRSSLGVSGVEYFPVLPYEKTGHIDIFAKVAGDKRVLVSDSKNPERKKVLSQVAAKFKDLGYQVTRVTNAESAGDNAWTKTYTNSLFVNGTAFVPGYYDSTITDDEDNDAAKTADAAAVAVYKSLGFKVIQIPMTDMMFYGGAIHCLTSQIPAGVPPLTSGH